MDKSAIYALMMQHRYGVVSSISRDGYPQSALVGIATSPELEIIFDTVKSSRKYPNLIERPRCSFVIGWSGEQTLQYEGIAEEPQGSGLAAIPGGLLFGLAGRSGATQLAGDCIFCGTSALDSLQRLRSEPSAHPGALLSRLMGSCVCPCAQSAS